ncbi:MAG: DNA-3-methyladenine glycosylase I [Actinomycetia bacterium]|nr:DNA-3-methyladenine glycosylase I [Actinomycetes bacterium]
MVTIPDGLAERDDGTLGCWWHGADELYVDYHDNEWGRPVGRDTRLFEKACLEGFQSGLSWLTILRKRENFRAAFDGFDFEKVAGYTTADVERLLGDAGIIRHRGKIEATINNAQRAIELIDDVGSLAAFFWRYEPGPDARPKVVNHAALIELATTPESTALSKDLKKRGWKFVGPTTMYALMQAMGIVNDHLEGCAMREVVEADREAFARPF